MKKLTIVSTLFLTLSVISPVFAESNHQGENSVRSEFEAKRLEIQNKIRENKNKSRDSRDDLKKDLKHVNGEVKKEVKHELKDMRGESHEKGAMVRTQVSIRVLEATLVRLDTLVVRIDSRIQELNQKGASTTDAIKFVNAAKTDLVNAKAHINILKSLHASVGSSTGTSTATTTIMMNFDKIKAEAKLAREALTSAKQNLMRAISAIKKVENALRKNATTTSSVHNE